MRRSRVALIGSLTALVLGSAVAPADATVVDRGSYSGTESSTYNDCGYPVEVHAEFSGTYIVRAGKHAYESAFYLTDNYTYREVHTNPQTGQWLVVRGNGVFKDVKATRVDGSVFEFLSMNAGQPFVVEDSSGNVVLRDRGALRFRYLFDTGGDDEPGGTFVEFLGLDVGGPHPGFFTDFCQIAGDLIGTGSAERLTARPAGSTDSPLGYYEYLPPEYGSGEPNPLLVFLHGGGANGNGSAAELDRVVMDAGIPYQIWTNGWPAEHPFVVLAPQHDDPAEDAHYAPCFDVEYIGTCLMAIQHDLSHPTDGSVCLTPTDVQTFITYALANYDVDPERVYLTGLSCGGFATFEYIAEHGASQVAAAVPIAGEGRPAWNTVGCDLGEVAIWAFHGEVDDVVHPAGSIEPLTNLTTCPLPPRRDARLTVYADVDHDSWTRTYTLSAGHDIYSWLLEHKGS